MDDNAAGDIDRHVSYQRSAWSAPDGVSVVRMPMQDQIDVMAVDHRRQFNVAEQWVLDDRLAAKGRRRRREMRDHDRSIGFEAIESRVQTGGFTSCPDSQGLAGFSRQRVWSFNRPESAARAAHTRDPDSLPIDVKDARCAIEHGDPAGRKSTTKCGPSHRSPIVIAEYCHNRQGNSPKELRREFRLQERAVIGDITRDHQQIRTHF
jgi:hypothetical protein